MRTPGASCPTAGQHVLRCLYQELTESRDHRRDELAVILAGHKALLHELLQASPPLAARFPAIIDIPGYTAAQLPAIFAELAAEAGSTLTPTPPARPPPSSPKPKTAAAAATPGSLSAYSPRPPPARPTASPQTPVGCRILRHWARSAFRIYRSTCIPTTRPQASRSQAFTCNALCPATGVLVPRRVQALALNVAEQGTALAPACRRWPTRRPLGSISESAGRIRARGPRSSMFSWRASATP